MNEYPWSDELITRLRLKPGMKGTKALVEKYGDTLVCVRYRYDEANHIRIKTVELIVEKKELPPRHVLRDEAIVPVQIGYGEHDLRKLARSAGGKWDPDVKLWYFQYSKIKGTELERHMLISANAKK